jgi:hypothetical protein
MTNLILVVLAVIVCAIVVIFLLDTRAGRLSSGSAAVTTATYTPEPTRNIALEGHASTVARSCARGRNVDPERALCVRGDRLPSVMEGFR